MFGDYTNGTDVFPSMATISAMVGLSNATKVHPHRRKLVEYGYLADTGARSAADTVVYCLTAPAEVIAEVQARREAGARQAPERDPLKGEAVCSEPSAPLAGDQPATVPTGPIELSLEQKMWFLGGEAPDAWPWPDVPYAVAEDAYRLYTRQLA
ncbi:hypothetical protein [Streptomyces griseosporeus]